MRVALVIRRYDALGGGAERWTDRHARFLLDRGIDVHLVASEFRKPPKGAICHEVAVPRGSQRRLRFAEALERALRRERFDVVHDMGDGWYGDLFMPHHGVRAAGLEQNVALLPPWLRGAQRFFHRVLPRYREFAELERRQYAADRATTFIALSRMVRAHMIEHHGVRQEKIEVVYNGVDVDHFRPGDGTRLRKTWGWNERTVFLLAAHNFRLKGLETVIRALGRLPQRRPQIGLVVVGSDRSGPFRRLARRLGCEREIRFLGNQKDPIPVFRAADVYVQPTYYDPCSLVVLEALACGLPVITSAQNGAGEILTPGVEGAILADPADYVGLARMMSEYLDPAPRRRAGRAARHLAENHSLVANGERLLGLYRQRLGLDRAA